MIKRQLIGSIFLAAATMAMTAEAAEEYQAPRTEWGQPDLQGVWNFSSDVPMQRPAQFGNRQFLTAEEIAAIKAAEAERDANFDGALAISGVDESYNDFWIENAGIGDTVRTSHIIYIPRRDQRIAASSSRTLLAATARFPA